MNGCAPAALAVEFLLGVLEPAALGDAWLVNRHLRLERGLRARESGDRYRDCEHQHETDQRNVRQSAEAEARALGLGARRLRLPAATRGALARQRLDIVGGVDPFVAWR